MEINMLDKLKIAGGANASGTSPYRWTGTLKPNLMTLNLLKQKLLKTRDERGVKKRLTLTVIGRFENDFFLE